MAAKCSDALIQATATSLPKDKEVGPHIEEWHNSRPWLTEKRRHNDDCIFP